MAVMSAGLILTQLVGFIYVSITGARELEWKHYAGSRRYFVGLGSHIYLGRFQFPVNQAPPAPNETGLASVGLMQQEVHFWLGWWFYERRDIFYSTVPSDTYDPQKISQYRRAVEHDRKVLLLDVWRCAGVLAVLPALVFLRMAYRYYLRRREFLLSHCRICGYDLRATPLRCPECGTAVNQSAGIIARPLARWWGLGG